MLVIFGLIGAALGAAVGEWSGAVLGFGVGFLLWLVTTFTVAPFLLTAAAQLGR